MTPLSNTHIRWLLWAAVLVVMAVATLLHLDAAYDLPSPWPDESHFVTPAMTLAGEGRLAVPELNAPEGIFWMPAGYYVAQVPLLVAGIAPLAAGRWLSLLGVLTFAVAVMAVAIRAGVNRWVCVAAVGVWLCLPRVVAMGNIARMEALILALAGLCLWLTATDRWPAAVSVSALAPLVHPIGLVVTVSVVAARLVKGRGRAWAPWERALAVAVVLAWLAQIGYFAAHSEAARDHLEFQLTRKAGRPLTVAWAQLLFLIPAAVVGAVSVVRWRPASPALVAGWIAFALSGALVLVDIVGREMWYWVLGRETVVLLVALVVAAAVQRLRVPDTPRRVAVMLVVVCLAAGAALGARATVTDGAFAMRARSGTAREWRDYVTLAVGELQRLDAEATAPATVLIDPLSGFAQEVFARDWDHLRFVQPTPATPLDPGAAEYILATPGAPFVTRSLVDGWGVQPALEVESATGRFVLQLFANPQRS